MSWKDILKSKDIEDELIRMDYGERQRLLEKASKVIENYVEKLLEKKFPVTTEKDLSDTSLNAVRPFRVSAGGSFLNSNMFKDIKDGDTFKLGELTFKPYRLSKNEDQQTTGIVFGNLLFNNVKIGEFQAYNSHDTFSMEPVHTATIDYNGYYGGEPEDLAIVELYRKIKRG